MIGLAGCLRLIVPPSTGVKKMRARWWVRGAAILQARLHKYKKVVRLAGECGRRSRHSLKVLFTRQSSKRSSSKPLSRASEGSAERPEAGSERRAATSG